jgi:hypothetical protein
VLRWPRKYKHLTPHSHISNRLARCVLPGFSSPALSGATITGSTTVGAGKSCPAMDGAMIHDSAATATGNDLRASAAASTSTMHQMDLRLVRMKQQHISSPVQIHLKEILCLTMHQSSRITDRTK